MQSLNLNSSDPIIKSVASDPNKYFRFDNFLAECLSNTVKDLNTNKKLANEKVGINILKGYINTAIFEQMKKDLSFEELSAFHQSGLAVEFEITNNKNKLEQYLSIIKNCCEPID